MREIMVNDWDIREFNNEIEYPTNDKKQDNNFIQYSRKQRKWQHFLKNQSYIQNLDVFRNNFTKTIDKGIFV